MKIKSFVIAGALTAALTPTLSFAADQMSAEQKKEIEKVVHDYLVNNPEVLVEVSQSLQNKQQKDMQDQAKSAIQKHANQLFSGKLTQMGNPNGSVTLVEFFDYQCVHCKKMAPVISELVKKDKNLRVIYKEFPIFGKSSDLASRAALAAAMQGKYKAMHEALLKQDKRLDENLINQIAKSIGLDMTKLKKDMDSKEVGDLLAQNRTLAENLRLMGTPAFIIGATPNGQFKQGSETSFIPGAASEEALQSLIKQAAGA